MAKLLILAKLPDGVSSHEFNRWYDFHVQEILTLPQFIAAERFELQFVRSSSGEVPPFHYGLEFEIEGELAPAWEALESAVEEWMTFPDWMPKFSAAVWERLPLANEGGPCRWLPTSC